MDRVSEKLKNEGARLTLYRDAPEWDGQAAFAVGQFACETPEAGAALLEKVADLARNEGATALVGPMDGDTWHSYRLVTETDGSKPFLMEPGGKAHDRTAFEVADFARGRRKRNAARGRRIAD